MLRLRLEDDARPLDELRPREEDACPLDDVREEAARPLDDALVLEADFLLLTEERDGVADFRLLVVLLLDFLLEAPEDWLRDFFIDD